MGCSFPSWVGKVKQNTYVPLKTMQRNENKLRASHFGMYSEKVHFKNCCIFVFLT